MDQMMRISQGFGYGIMDSICGIFAIRRIYLDERHRRSQKRSTTTSTSSATSNNILQRISQCIVFNGGIFGVSILIFNHLVLRWLYFLMQFVFGSHQGMVSSVWFWLEPTLLYTFSAFWVLPLFFISRVVNALWFQDIADTAFRGRPQPFRSISTFIADTLFSLLIQALFLLQALIVEFFPISILARIVSVFHLSVLYSLYSFEYKWFNMGWELHRRLHFIENNWPYFLGFGLPLAIATCLPNSYYLSGCIFSILFPLFIISANEARPRTGFGEIHIHFFNLVVWLSNKILFLIFRFKLFGR